MPINPIIDELETAIFAINQATSHDDLTTEEWYTCSKLLAAELQRLTGHVSLLTATQLYGEALTPAESRN